MKTPSSKTRIKFTLPLTREEAERIDAMGPEARIYVMLELSARLAGQDNSEPSPSTPSGMVPVYAKPAASKRSKKPGAKPGHPGARRAKPEITHREEHPPMKRCPACGGALKAATERRFRLIEEIAETQPEVTEHGIPRQWCPTCRKPVEPPVVDALPGARFGHRVTTLSAWLHYGLGVTISQVVEVFDRAMHFKVSKGGLVDAWEPLARSCPSSASPRDARCSIVDAMHWWRRLGTTRMRGVWSNACGGIAMRCSRFWIMRRFPRTTIMRSARFDRR